MMADLIYCDDLGAQEPYSHERLLRTARETAAWLEGVFARDEAPSAPASENSSRGTPRQDLSSSRRGRESDMQFENVNEEALWNYIVAQAIRAGQPAMVAVKEGDTVVSQYRERVSTGGYGNTVGRMGGEPMPGGPQ